MYSNIWGGGGGDDILAELYLATARKEKGDLKLGICLLFNAAAFKSSNSPFVFPCPE